MEDGRISYISELSTKGFAEGANEIQRHVRKMSDEVERSSSKMDAALDKIGTRVKQAFAVGSFVEFGKKIVEVRSEMESLQKSFESLAGEHIGRQLYEDIKQFAVTTPMMMNNLAKGAQTLLGFNIEAQKVMLILRQIGDISMGDAEKFNSLTLAFAQMSSTGKLMGQDLLQMINAGFNPLVVMSEKTGKSVAQLKEEMSKGAITVEMVEDAFKTATSEGGKFYRMLETQSKTMKGAISNAKGAIEEALNDMGEKTEGVMLKGINMVTVLAKNYETIGRVLMQLVVTYGSYKAAVIAVSLAEDLLNGKYVMKIRLLRAAAVAQEMLNKAMLKNPFVLVAAGILSLVSALVIFGKRTDEAAEAQKKLDDTFRETQAQIATEGKEIDILFDKLRKADKGTKEYKDTKDKILNQYGQYLKGLGDEIETLKDVEGAYRAVAKAAREAALARGREAALKDVQENYGTRYTRNVGSLQEALVGKLGSDKANQLLGRLKKELRDFGSVSVQLEKRIKDALRGTADYGNASAWIQGLRNNEKYLNDYTKLVDERFKVDEEKDKKEQFNVERTKSVIEEEKKALQAKLDNLSKEKAIGKDGANLKKQIRDLDKELKAYDASYKGSSKEANAAKKSAKDAEDEARRRQKFFEADMKQTEEQARQKRELNDAIRDLEIANEQDNAKRELMQMQKDHEDKLEAIREQADQWKKEAYKAAEERWNATNQDKTKAFADTAEGKAGWQAQSLTPEQEQTIQARVNAEITKYLREESALYKSHYDSIISSHQSYSDKKLAIDRKYREEALAIDKAIAEAEKNNDRKAVEQLKRTRAELEKDHAKQQADLSLEQLKLDPNYIRAFEDLDNTSTETLEHLIKMFEDSKQAAGKSLDPKDLKEYTSAIQQMQDKMTERDPFKALAQSSRELTEAHKRVKKAEEDLETVRKGGFIQIMDVDKKTGEVTFHILEQAEAENRLREAKDGVIKAASKYNKAQQAAFAIIENLGNSVSNLGDSIGGTAGKIVSLIGDVISFASGAITALGKTTEGVSKAIQAAEKASAILAIISAVLQIVTKITDIMGADYESYDRLVGQYENLCDIWDELINKKKEYISISYGAEILKVGAEELYILNRQIEAYRTLGRERLNSGASIGSHSIGVRIQNGMALSDWSDIRNVLGDYDLGGRLEGLFDLSAEQLEKLREGAPAFWSKLDEDVRKYLNGIIDGAKEIDDAIKQINERLTGTTSEDVFEKLMNSLYDFADGSEDAFDEIEKNWQRMINKMVLDNVIAKDLQDKVEDWYKRLADFQKKRNGYTSEEMEALNAEKAAIEEELATRERDFFNNPFNLLSPEAIEEYFKKRDELLKRLEEINNTNTEPLTDEEYQKGLEAFYEEYSKLLDLPIEKIKELTDMGFIKPIGDAVDEAAEKFGDLRSKFIDTLMDMEFDAEEWKKELQQTMLKDLIEQNVLNVPITVTVDGQEQVFDNFDAYAKEWNKRYNDALKAGDEAAIQALIDELIEQQGLMAKAAEDYRQRMQEATDTTFKDMSDSWTSTLMDMTKSADDWSQDVGRTMAEKIISQMVAPVMMQPLLDKLQDAFNTAMSADEATWKSVMTDGSVLAALDAIKDAYPELQEVVKQIMQALGVTVNEEAKEGFSDLKGTIISALMDSDGDIKKFAADLGKGMVEQMVKAMTDQKYGEQIKALNEEWASALESGDPARIEAVKQKVLELYAAIGNDEEVKKLLDDIRELGESTPFDNLQDSFLSTLMNMEGSADDFVKDLKKKLAEALVNDIVIGKDFADKLEYYKEQYKRIMGDPSLSDEERAKAIRDLADTWREYTEGKKAEADEINKWLGTYEHEDQQATMNMANAATYDQYELSLGMQTSQLMVAEQHKEISRQILETLQGMNGLTKPGTNYGEQIFMRLGTTNEYLLAMKKELIAMHSEFGAKFDNMNSHLNKL